MTALSVDATVAVIGAGTMGAGIAQVAATAGHPVLLFDVAEGAVAAGIAGVTKALDRSVERGRIEAAEREAILDRIKPAAALVDLAQASLVIEAILERLDIKQELFKDLEGIVGPDAILASNTSSLSITAIAAALDRPERLAGMHFFNPAPVMALVEVVTGLVTDDATKETLFDTSVAWGKSPVLATSTPGFIANRIARPFYSEALRLVQEGAADAVTIDTIVKECGGFRMGPFELMDLIGVDVNLLVTRSVWEAFHYDPRYQPSLLQEELVAAGRFGRKSGAGWYDYRDGAVAPAPAEAPQGPRPKRITLTQDPSIGQLLDLPVFDPASQLAQLAEKAGIEISYDAGELPFDIDDIDLDGLEPGAEIEASGDENFSLEAPWREYRPDEETAIQLDGAILKPARGIAAFADTWGAPDENPTVFYDLCLDYTASPRIAIAAAHDAPRTAILAAAGFFQAIGKSVTVVQDAPGMVVTRIVAMLANEAADAVYYGVCTEDDADTAMLKGLNYPKGPLAWSREVGCQRIVDTLDAMFEFYHDPRYRASPLLRRMAAGESSIELEVDIV
jgi:3-hydroxybutyryl-CoA dehydrogenase